MADNTRLNEATTIGDLIATEDIGGVKHELVIVEYSDDAGGAIKVSPTNKLPVSASIDTTGLATDTLQTAGNASLASIDTKLTNPLPISGTVTTSETPPTTILNGKTTVATAGTSVVLASSTPCKSVTVKALIGNTGLIYVGNSSVSSANGFELSAGDSCSLDISNLNTVNIDSDNNGEGVSYVGNF